MKELGLVRYDHMCKAISECSRVDEAKEIRDRAKALEVYAAQALNTEAEEKACSVRVRAERRTGELLKEAQKAGQRAKTGKPKKISLRSEVIKPPTLKDIGISTKQSSQWQKLADITLDERRQNERRLRHEGEAKIVHADALKAETEAMLRRGELTETESETATA
jgi:hypothetical protein